MLKNLKVVENDNLHDLILFDGEKHMSGAGLCTAVSGKVKL